MSHDSVAPVAKQTPLQRREVDIPITDFTLIDQNARPLRFEALRGKVIVVAFGYTTCPDVCPLTTAALREVQDGLSRDQRRRAYLLMLTTDPEIDSPAVLAAYAKRYNVDLSNWSFLTGDAASLAKIWKGFGVKVQRKARGLIDHTSLTVVVDTKGIMRFVYYGAAPDAKVVLKDMKTLFLQRYPS